MNVKDRLDRLEERIGEACNIDETLIISHCASINDLTIGLRDLYERIQSNNDEINTLKDENSILLDRTNINESTITEVEEKVIELEEELKRCKNTPATTSKGMKFIKLNMYGEPCIYPLSGLHIEFCGGQGEKEFGGIKSAYGEIIFHQNVKNYKYHTIVPWPAYIKLVEEIECFIGNEERMYDVSERSDAIGKEIQLAAENEYPKCENGCPKCGSYWKAVPVYPNCNYHPLQAQCSNPTCGYMPWKQ